MSSFVVENYFCDGECGAATILLVAVLLPLFFLLLTVTVEMNSFLAQRQLAQEILDMMGRQLLRTPQSREEVSQAIKERLKSHSAFVVLHGVSTTRIPTQATVQGEFSYITTFAGLFPTMKGVEQLKIPFQISTRISRVPYDVILLTDRSIQSSEGSCQSSTLTSLNNFSRTLYSSAEIGGASSIIAGILDPASSEVVRLDSKASGLHEDVLCNGDIGYVAVKDALASLKGVAVYPLDPHVFVNSVQESIFQERTKAPSRKQIVLLLTRGFDDRWKPLEGLVPALEQNAQTTGLVVSLTRVIIDEGNAGSSKCENEWKSINSQSISSRCISVRSDGQLNGTLLTALLADSSEAILER
jgi:hypothetical protein